ncbi:MAG: glycosyltransferase involved in cell wall biosynthesis [Phenylobacterium sp.]|jgi:glycosyltransferase involved in cell wall biosynthesis
MIYSVSTVLQGGIATALTNYRDSVKLQQYGIEFIASHVGKQRLTSACGALSALFTKVQPGDIGWFHCASWVSISRKLLLILAAKTKKAKIVVQFHSQGVERILKYKSGLWLVNALLSQADGVIVLTPWWLQYFSEKFPKHSHKMFVCPNPIDDDLAQAAAQPHHRTVPSPQVKLLAMSRLIAGKGFEQVLDTMAVLPQHYHLSIAGEGELMGQLKAQAKLLGIEKRVDFLGWVDGQQKSQVLADHQVFFLPSRNDAFGMGFVEAMAYGLPVVALNNQATPDVVLNGRTGVLCDTDTPQALSEAIIHCTEHSQSMGAMGKQHVLTAFDNETLVNDLIRFFDGL